MTAWAFESVEAGSFASSSMKENNMRKSSAWKVVIAEQGYGYGFTVIADTAKEAMDMAVDWYDAHKSDIASYVMPHNDRGVLEVSRISDAVIR